MLWGETGDERARHNLRQSLLALRRSCGAVIVSQDELLGLDQAACGTDVAEFDRLARSKSPDDLLRCLELYRGDLLEDLDPREPVYEEWLSLARARFRRAACQAVDDLVSALAAAGRNEEAIQALQRRLSMDPCCEAAHRQLMDLLARAGRRSDALRQFQVCAENLSGDSDACFVDGIVEDITTALSCFHSLVVIARGASFAYRNRDVSERRIADDLGAQFLVRGSVRRAGRKVRVNIRLLDSFAGTQLWGHRFDRDLEDLFEVQDEITSTVVSTLVGKVEAARLDHARGAPTRMLDAYDLYLRGKDHHHRYTAEDCQRCIDLFTRAIERDPRFAVAHTWLACGLGQAMVFELDDQAKLVDRCQAAAEKGLELDENESECHRILAQVFLTRGDLKRSLWHQERGLFLNPNDDRLVCAMGEILTFVGRHEEAEGWIRKSMQLNPYHPPRYWTHLGRALFHLGKYEESLAAFDRIARARNDDLAYRVAASARSGDALALRRSLSALREAIPAFETSAFAASLPYEREQDRRDLVDALRGAGLDD